MRDGHWNGFVLPEQKATLNKIRNKRAQAEKPHLDDQQKEAISTKLLIAENSYLLLEITYYEDGQILTAKGRFHKLDRLNGVVMLRGPGCSKVPLENLLDVFIL